MIYTTLFTREDIIRAKWCARKMKREISAGKRTGVFDFQYIEKAPKNWLQAVWWNLTMRREFDMRIVERPVGAESQHFVKFLETPHG